MAYTGSTAASSLANPFRALSGPGLYGRANSSALTTVGSTAHSGMQQGGQLWSYVSTNMTTDLMDTATIATIADGYELGMRPGDVVMAVQFTSAESTPVLSFHVIATVNSTAGTAYMSTAANATLTSTYA